MTAKKGRGHHFTTEQITGKILAILKDHPNKPFNYKQIAKHLGLHSSDVRDDILEVLAQLREQGEVLETDHGKYRIKPTFSYIEGYIDITASGAAYVVNDDYEDDIYIAPSNVKNALHGDLVKISLYARKKNRRLEGTVVDIKERARTEFAGTLQVSDRFAFLVSDSRKMPVDIFIPPGKLGAGKNGDKAVVRMTEFSPEAKNPVGEVIEVLGRPGENNAEMNAILIEYGFPTKFPAFVEDDAARIETVITKEEIARRKDFRDITTFTIDPYDAKDFDDALSIRKLADGLWEIGIHIADVTHYVKPGTALEKEGYARATSVYLVDRVIPMLPEVLSNNVCSLRPHEEKLCFSVVVEMDEHAKVLKEWTGRTVINSDHRFTYEEAQEVIETGKGKFSEEILTLDRLAKQLRRVRFKNGAISFDRLEVKFHLDAKGNPTGVFVKENKDSNKLIEEFMLLANRHVASLVGKARKGHTPRPMVYRVHDGPQAEKLNVFKVLAEALGYRVDTNNDRAFAHSINILMKDIKGTAEENILENLAVRTMSKAIYTTENIGHYGLAFDYYTHFTSPIRRYPDMMVHRIVASLLEGKPAESGADLETRSKHSSKMEFTAADAERASVKYKQAQFLLDKTGMEFNGVISGVTEWGIYVELEENKCEGMIRLRDIDDDFYEFDDNRFCITGHRTGNVYRLGDSVRVRVKKVDLVQKQVDFELTSKGSGSKKRSGPSSPGQSNDRKSGNRPFAKNIKPKGGKKAGKR
jgi:ribonuclease R